MEDVAKYQVQEDNTYTYVLTITKTVAVRARSESEALSKAKSCNFGRIGRDEYKLIGKLQNTNKEID